MYRIVKFGRFVLFFSVFVISKSYGQAVSSTQNTSDNQPKVVVSFREAEPIHIPEISPVMATPMQCTDRGAFVGMLQPPQYQKELLLSISLSGNTDIRAFRTEQISDLFDIQKLGYFAANSSVAMLVYASRENKHGEQTITTSSGDSSQRTGNTGEHHYYIVWFDNDGKYQKFTQIEDAFRPHTIATFPSGNLLISGYANAHLHLALMKNDGTILQYIDLPAKYTTSLESKSTIPDAPAGTLLGREQLVAFQDSLILVESGSRLPPFQISESGAIHAIPLKLKDNLEVDTLLVDDTHMYARVNLKDSTNAKSKLLFEVSAQDGSLIQEFSFPKNVLANAIACVHQGSLVAFRYGGEGTLIPLLGAPQ